MATKKDNQKNEIPLDRVRNIGIIAQQVPGKFKATKPAFVEWKEKRKKLIIPYFITWIVFFSLFS